MTSRRDALDRGIAPVMADIERQHPGLLRVAAPETASPGLDAWLIERGGGGTGLFLDWDGTDLDAVLTMTGQVQEVALETVWGVTGNGAWPECPAHPQRSPLDFDQHEGRVYWFCPHDGHVVSEVGRLGLATDQDNFGFTFPVPAPPPAMTEAEAEALAAEMRRSGAPDARVGRIGLRHVVEFSSGDGGYAVETPGAWTHLRALRPHVGRPPSTPQGFVGGILGPKPPDNID